MLGGLARRATAIDGIRTEAAEAGRSLLVIDTGDNLFAEALVHLAEREEARTRARGIMRAMGEMSYVAMAVGARDLAGGYELLLSASQNAGVRLLAANLEVSGGRVPIDAYEIIEAGKVRVALLGLASADHSVQVSEVFRSAGVLASDPVTAAKNAIEEIGDRADIVIILGNLSEREVIRVGAEVSGAHLLLTGGGGHLTMAEEQREMLRYEPGSLGQILLQLDISPTPGTRLMDPRSRYSRTEPAAANVTSQVHPLHMEIAEDPRIKAIFPEEAEQQSP